MIVEFKRNGRQKQMNPKLARLLAKQGHVRIIDAGVQTSVVEKPVQVTAEVIVENDVKFDIPDIDAMEVDELRELAAAQGITVHHRAGAERIRELLRDPMQ